MSMCVKHPDREATYNSPDTYCDVCWEMWFTEGYHEDSCTSEEDLVDIRQSDLLAHWATHQSPGPEMEEAMLKEIVELTHEQYKQSQPC